jgi:hypothetical protein
MAPPPPATDALARVAALIEAQSQALISGDLHALEDATHALQRLMSDAPWQRALATQRQVPQLKRIQAQLQATALLGARVQASTNRRLTALGIAPTVYTAKGSLRTKNPFQRRTAA